MATLLLQTDEDPIEKWLPELRRTMPEMEIRVYPELGEVAEIDYALVWKPPAGLLSSLPNLQLIHSIGAGMDHLLRDPDLPKGLPILRMVDDYLRDQMSEYALLGVLYFHRNMDLYGRDRTREHWQVRWPFYTPETTVGILGLGALGGDIAQKFQALNFNVIGWSRRQKQLDSMQCFAGEEGLASLLAQSDYLVCVLPLTPETENILNRKTLSQLPPGAVVVNLARGGHLVEADLLALLDAGHLRGAFLDVFQAEPLAPDHGFWRHPKIMMTPHMAGVLVPRSCAEKVAKNIQRFEAGEPLDDLLDLSSGY